MRPEKLISMLKVFSMWHVEFLTFVKKKPAIVSDIVMIMNKC